jgi:nucleoside-diphosphate-sugar epimerase
VPCLYFCMNTPQAVSKKLFAGPIMITGAAGFIGSRVVSMLSALSCDVLALDNLYIGRSLPKKTANVVPIEADIRERDTLLRIFSEYRPKSVIHLAAVHHIPTCEANPWLAFESNVMGTQAVLDAAALAGTQYALLASSGAVYDWVDGALSEDITPLKARDVYATTKLTNEYQLASWAARTGGHAQVARIFNTIGHDDPNGHLIPDILSQLQGDHSSSVVRLGNLKPKRDYIYVEDVASALVVILGNITKSAPFDVFNVCRGEEYSVSELVHILATILKLDVSVEQESARIRKVDRLQQLGNPTKMKTHFGWSAEWNLRNALAEMLAKGGVQLTGHKQHPVHSLNEISR